jgi:hypothetical protein
VAIVCSENVPAKQAVHAAALVALVATEYVPAAQASPTVLFVGLYVPWGQGVHPLKIPPYPCWHTHALTVVEPCGAREYAVHAICIPLLQ